MHSNIFRGLFCFVYPNRRMIHISPATPDATGNAKSFFAKRTTSASSALVAARAISALIDLDAS